MARIGRRGISNKEVKRRRIGNRRTGMESRDIQDSLEGRKRGEGEEIKRFGKDTKNRTE